MRYNLPNLLTLLRIALIPVFGVVFLLPFPLANVVATAIFILAALTDWLDGYLARKLGEMSSFGAFLDPVADKLMVATAIVLLLREHPTVVMTVPAAVIIGREIAVSALREWMAEVGARAKVAVSSIGKFKTIVQMVALSMMIYGEPLWGIPIYQIGYLLFYVAAVLTIWSMLVYIRAAWPALTAE